MEALKISPNAIWREDIKMLLKISILLIFYVIINNNIYGQESLASENMDVSGAIKLLPIDQDDNGYIDDVSDEVFLRISTENETLSVGNSFMVNSIVYNNSEQSVVVPMHDFDSNYALSMKAENGDEIVRLDMYHIEHGFVPVEDQIYTIPSGYKLVHSRVYQLKSGKVRFTSVRFKLRKYRGRYLYCPELLTVYKLHEYKKIYIEAEYKIKSNAVESILRRFDLPNLYLNNLTSNIIQVSIDYTD